MGWMEQVRSSMIAGALLAVWVAQPDWVLGEVPSDNRGTAGRDNTVGGTGGGTDSLSAREFGLAPTLSRAECTSTSHDAARIAVTASPAHPGSGASLSP